MRGFWIPQSASGRGAVRRLRDRSFKGDKLVNKRTLERNGGEDIGGKEVMEERNKSQTGSVREDFSEEMIPEPDFSPHNLDTQAE